MGTVKVSVLYDTIRWEEKALLEAGRKQGADISMIDCRNIALGLDDTAPSYGTVLQRCVSYYRNIHSTAALEGMGVRVINPLNTGIFAGNKLFTHMLLQKAGVPTPYAAVAFSKDAALDHLDRHGYPMVIKPTVGSWGRLVSKLNNPQDAGSIMEGREGMYPIYQIHYLEEFVQRPPRDIRAIVVGNEVAAAIYRTSSDGQWKTNMALGGKAEPCPVTGELEDICMKARDTVQGQIIGVDLMESQKSGLVVHEINNTTEYKNTVRVCGVDIPGLIIQYALHGDR